MAPLLSCGGVSKSFGGRLVLKSCSLTLEAGKIVLLTGPSGLGKSTFLEILAGVQAPDSGAVARRGMVSLMFQDNALIPWLSAEANLLYVSPPGAPKGASKERARRWLELFGLEGAARPPEMSGGMRRRLSLARTFFAERPILILDEPFAFLDRQWHALIARLLAEAAAGGSAALLAGHSVNPELTGECGSRLEAVAAESSPLEIRFPSEGAGA